LNLTAVALVKLAPAITALAPTAPLPGANPVIRGATVKGLALAPSYVKPGTIASDVMSREDWLPTFLAAAGDRGAGSVRAVPRRTGDEGARERQVRRRLAELDPGNADVRRLVERLAAKRRP
jgi:hypothetical protein